MSLTFALQALLVRHESQMARAEEERQKMTGIIDKLEVEKRELEESNARAIQDNRNLLDQLEDLNNTIGKSDTHIQSLSATLDDTRREFQRLTILAGRTAQLEAQLQSMEIEQANLRAELCSKEDLNRTTVQRWKAAERTIDQLQAQIDKIEREAREERERHVDIVGHLERQRVAEKELESAAGRLKGAATATAMGRQQTGSNVVSHFVKDILQDNAKLQMGIRELRDLLLGSNAEVEHLREQMLLHQPLEERGQRSLLAELGNESPLETLPELHVHHHYHGPETSKRDKVPVHRKPRKRRAFVTPGHFSPYSGSSTPRTLYDQATWETSSATKSLPLRSSAIPPSLNTSNRWSINSHAASSSVPSTAQSEHRASSVFDSIDAALSSSWPISPASSNPDSPVICALDDPSSNKPPHRNVSAPTPLQLQSPDTQQLWDHPHSGTDSTILDVSGQPGPHTSSRGQETIYEEPEHDIIHDSESPFPDSASPFSDASSPFSSHHPHLRHAASHESLLSISGMDIHTLRNRPSQIFTGQGFTPRIPYPAPSPTLAQASSKAIMSPTLATGRPAFQRQGKASSEYNRSLLSARARNASDGKPTLGQRVGGWVFGGWGVSSMASTGDLRAKASGDRLSQPNKVRHPGVNQSGPIKGLNPPPPKARSLVQPVKVDTDLLQEALGEG